MAKRGYQLGRRAETAEETRRRILDAAYELIAAAGFHPVSVDAVAAKSGVTRVTVYRHFGSKRGLFEAVALGSVSGDRLEGLEHARAQPDPIDAVRDFLREICRLMDEIGDTLRISLEVARDEPEVAHLVDVTYYVRRKSSAELLARRLDDANVLAPGWSRQGVADAIMVLTSLETFDTLTRVRRRSLRRAGEILFDMARAFLVLPPQERKTE